LNADLDIQPLRRTTLITVSYRSTDPDLAARVPNELGRLYLEKHMAVHRPEGAYEFFSEQTDRLRSELTAAEKDLLGYGRTANVVSADVERDDALKRLADFEAQLEQTRAEKAAATRHLAELSLMAAQTAERLTTQVTTGDNPGLIAALRNKVLELELRRTELLTKFLPTYQPVVQIEEQLAQARDALAAAEQAPAHAETTDANPIYGWLQNEIARVNAESQAASARETAIQESVRLFQRKARTLDEKSAVQQELRRRLKNAEDNYVLYRQKQEEARISDALDRARISNVAIAEPATVPVLPSGGAAPVAMAGVLAAVLLGLAATYVRHFTSPHLHTPDEVEEALDVPVLASVAANRR
jgi:uncharacterized protein involved in exopolysaccharide biosynthesis